MKSTNYAHSGETFNLNEMSLNIRFVSIYKLHSTLKKTAILR